MTASLGSSPRFKAVSILLAAFSMIFAGPAAFAASGKVGGVKVIMRIAGPDGPWDYAAVDPESDTLFVARGAGVMAVDLASKKVTPVLVAGERVHGIVPLPGKFAISANGDSGTVVIFDKATGAKIKTVPAGQKPDAVVFDPKSGFAFAMNGKSHDATVIDLAKQTVVGTIALGGKPEFAAADGQGLVYGNIEDTAEIVVIDAAAKKVTARWKLAGCREPSGLAYDPAGDLLISACRNGVAEIVDAKTGRELASLPIGNGPDAVIYDAGRRFVFIPNGKDGTLSVIALKDGPNASVIETVETQKGARLGAFDPKTGNLYLPTARFEAPAPPGGRPSAIPGSFELLVVATRDK